MTRGTKVDRFQDRAALHARWPIKSSLQKEASSSTTWTGQPAKHTTPSGGQPGDAHPAARANKYRRPRPPRPALQCTVCATTTPTRMIWPRRNSRNTSVYGNTDLAGNADSSCWEEIGLCQSHFSGAAAGYNKVWTVFRRKQGTAAAQFEESVCVRNSGPRDAGVQNCELISRYPKTRGLAQEGSSTKHGGRGDGLQETCRPSPSHR